MSKKWSSFLISILYLLLGIIVLMYRSSILTTMKFIIGIAFLVIGFIRIVMAFRKKEDTKKSVKIGDFTVGLIIAIVGILLLLPFFENLLAYAFGLFFIFDGVVKIVNAVSNANGKNVGWWISLIVAIAIIGVGIFIVAKWSVVVDYVAIIVGIVLIVSAIQGFIALLTGKKK